MYEKCYAFTFAHKVSPQKTRRCCMFSHIFFTFSEILTKKEFIEKKKYQSITLQSEWGKCLKSISLSWWDDMDYCLIDLHSRRCFLKKSVFNTGGLRWSVKWLIGILVVSEKNKCSWIHMICKCNYHFTYITIMLLIIIKSVKVGAIL